MLSISTVEPLCIYGMVADVSPMAKICYYHWLSNMLFNTAVLFHYFLIETYHIIPYWREKKSNFKKTFVRVTSVFLAVHCFIFVFIFQGQIYTLSDSEILWKCITIGLPYLFFQEMMGLTYFMLDQSRKEAEYCMENAFNTYLVRMVYFGSRERFVFFKKMLCYCYIPLSYTLINKLWCVQKLGLLGQQNATRCGLWWIEMLKARDLFKEAATVYFRICGEVLLF
jgi:hypothetical protein